MSIQRDCRCKKRMQGSVLFTTLVIMTLVLLIMLTTIGLAGAASKRAYSTWYDNQTKYTAQDLVDNVIESFGQGKPNEALGGAIVSRLTNKGGTPITVTVGADIDGDGVSDGNYIPGYGEVRSLTFQYVADNKKEFTIAGLKNQDNEKIIKVTAEVFMGGETSTYSTYVVGNAKSNRTDSNGGGYIALSNLHGGAGSNDAPATVGRFYAGIFDKINKTAGGNQTIDAGDVFFNTDEYKFNANKNDPAGIIVGRNDPENGYYGGMRITGDLKIDNGLTIQSQYPPAYITKLNYSDKKRKFEAISNENFYNIPYLYVDGDVSSLNTGISLKGYTDGTYQTSGMLNLYCGTLNINGNISGNINVMCMNESDDNKVTLSGNSSLIKWVSSNITVTDPSSLNVGSGNFYCKGNLEIGGDKTFEVNGDLLVVGDLDVTGSTKIDVKGGDAYIGGSLSGTVTVDSTHKVVSKIDSGKKVNTFLQKLKALDSVMEPDKVTKTYPNAQTAANKFETAYKLKADGVNGIDYVQTLDNIKKQFEKSGGGYADVVDRSDYTGTDVWNGKTNPITKSCIWNASSIASSPETIYINPGTSDLWINISPDLTTMSNKKIVVDDSQGGSVKFFIEKSAGATQSLDLKMTKIVTKKYDEMLYINKSLEPLSAFPKTELVPHIYMYAATGTKVNITMSDGNYMYTGDIIAPDATFTALSTNGVKLNADYTYYNYVDLDNDGVLTSNEKANPVRVSREMDICFLGSLEVGEINVTNQFGYLYVDDPPFNGGGPGLAGGYSWTTLDGYSTY